MARRRRRYRSGNFQRGYTGNVDDCVRRLREQGERVVEAAKEELKTGVDEVVADAKRRVRVDTGKLRDSIKAVSLEDGAAYEIEANAKNDKGIPYGQFEEFSPWGRPFLLPAIEANVEEIRENIKQAINVAARRGN